MLRVVGCLTQDHDLSLVALACLVCVLSTVATTRLLSPRHGGEQPRRGIRMGAAVVAFSTGVWTTHFIGMLAFRADLTAGFDISVCLASFLISVAATAIAFTIRPRGSEAAGPAIASGLVLAAGIGAMHFVGMRSLQVPGIMRFDPDLVITSLALGGLCAIAAMWLLTYRAAGWATLFLTLSVVCVHFIAMGSVSIELVAGIPVTPLAIPRTVLVIVTGSACLLIIVLAVAAALLDHQIARSVAKHAQRFHILAEATFEGLVFERGGQIVHVNRAMCKMVGRDAALLIGRPLQALLPGIDPMPHREAGNRLEHDLALPDGSIMPVEILWCEGTDCDEQVLAVRDISRQKAAEGQIERLAQFDPLTGLANRQLFEQQLQQSLALADRATIGLALLYVDLDRFEIINETLDLLGAEQVLIQTASRLSGVIREADTIARVGRDEFVIIQSLTGQPSDAAALADRIIAVMAAPFELNDGSIAITASVGVAIYPTDGTRAQDLIKSAILAVRQAKTDGKGQWRYFEPEMDLLQRTKRSLEHDLRVALKESQFSLNYQPFVDTATLQVVGYEALLRWDHSTRGRVSPADFIPLAEETGLIVPIGHWVLATACAEAVSWDKPLIISVNLSPAQFIEPGIVGTIADVLRDTGLPPSRLELEITEGTLMDDAQNAMRILTSLKALGVKIAMDDFGTGYSSLSYLRKFPFDKIKIDRSFVNDLQDGAEAETIVQAIIAMSQSLHLTVTAEGVETKQQLAMLRNHGCTLVQGYLLGRPSRATQLGLQKARPAWHVIDQTGQRTVVPSAARSA